MQIHLSNEELIFVDLLDNPIVKVYKKIYKHLQHINIPFRLWDSPFYTNNIQNLIDAGSALGISVDADKINNQEYLNYLHQIYEKSFDGNPDWLNFHEQVHLHEPCRKVKSLLIDYRELCGPLIRPFDRTWTNYLTTKSDIGDVIVSWSELGKTPYRYWLDQEPDNLNRVCELVKPWINLKPKINIIFTPGNIKEPLENTEFLNWWKQYQEPWCHHWKLKNWQMEHIEGAIPLGKISKIQFFNLEKNLKNNNYPTRVTF